MIKHSGARAGPFRSRVPTRKKESGLTGKPIETLIEHIEFDEGRDPVADRAWEKI
jgi:hypothetical protein